MGRRFVRSLKVFSFIFILTAVSGAIGFSPFSENASAAGGTAKGTIKYQDKTMEIKHAYLVKAPDTFEPSKTASTIILSPKDIGKEIAACDSSMCATGLTEGMTVGKEDLGGTMRVVYWYVTNDGMMQYSGNDDLSTLVLTTDTADKMAGKLTVDITDAGGPKIDVEFDAPLVKEFKK